jgi:hypothetical protein
MTSWLPLLGRLGALVAPGVAGWRGWLPDTRDPDHSIGSLLAWSRHNGDRVGRR